GPSISPKSMGPSIPFPLAQPTTDNILAICHYSNIRPRYTEDMLPGGFGYLHRQASAINQLESWFTVCCSNGTQDEEMTQCCAQQAWEKSLANFCNEEFSIKTRHYHCCKQNGQERWDCFKEEAPDPLYQPIVLGDEVPITLPSTIQDFDFNPSICKMTSISEKPVTMLPISFPPGRPNSGNFRPICVFRKYRPHYSTDCLPHKGYERFSYRLKTINGLEKSFRQCCKEKNDGQRCAEEKWKKMVDKFCNYEKKFQENQFECCKKQKGQEQYDCFSATAPNPDYMILNEPIQIGPFLSEFCDVYTDIQKM
ncbi:extracellular matrix protein 1 isoform X2, partial [Silurus meridionalis]